jgi:hypothetical protein
MTDQAPEGTPPGTPRPDPAHTPAMAVGEDTAAPAVAEAEVTPEVETPVETETPIPQIDASVTEQVVDMVKEAGLDPAEVARIMSDSGMTPAILKALAEKHGDGVANLIKAQLETRIEAGKAQATENNKTVYDMVASEFEGVTDQTGEQTWNELSTWAKTNVESSQRAEINTLLNQGGMAAKLAVRELISVFKKSSSYTQDANLMQADGVADTGAGKSLSKSDYDRELRTLLNSGHEYGVSQEINNLDRRRMKAISRGQ